MGNSTSSNKVSAQDRAILDMKIQRDKLHQYQKRIKVITDRETEIARECLRKGSKEKALLALRRKKYQESLLQNADKQLAQLEVLTSDIEFAQLQKSVVYGLQQGTNVLKQIHKEMGGLQNVEKLMGESEEARAYQEEVSEMLSGMSRQDEDEVDEELEAMEMEISGQKIPPGANKERPGQINPHLPDVPAQNPTEVERQRVTADGQRAEPMLA